MDRLPEADMLGARHITGLDDAPIRLKAKVQSGGVGLAADKAGSGVRQKLHTGNRRRLTETGKHFLVGIENPSLPSSLAPRPGLCYATR